MCSCRTEYRLLIGLGNRCRSSNRSTKMTSVPVHQLKKKLVGAGPGAPTTSIVSERWSRLVMVCLTALPLLRAFVLNEFRYSRHDHRSLRCLSVQLLSVRFFQWLSTTSRKMGTYASTSRRKSKTKKTWRRNVDSFSQTFAATLSSALFLFMSYTFITCVTLLHSGTRVCCLSFLFDWLPIEYALSVISFVVRQQRTFVLFPVSRVGRQIVRTLALLRSDFEWREWLVWPSVHDARKGEMGCSTKRGEWREFIGSGN